MTGRIVVRAGGAIAAVTMVACAGAPAPAAPGLGPHPVEVREIPIVPLPHRVAVKPGTLPAQELTRVTVSDPGNAELAGLAALLVEYARAAGIELRSGGTGRSSGHGVALELDGRGPAKSPEAYMLEVGAGGVVVRAGTTAGLARGVQTLRQLLLAGPDLPFVEIEDAPRFGYRGMHLDVARHFFPVEFIRKYIDLLALYRFNTFHWHLTDDQGWRIEIRRYPKLTEVGGCRKETRVGHARQQPVAYDGTPYCGHYTQDEIREIVAYAKARHITIIPEIEMPGHARAALAAYPELGCTPGPFETATTWGIFDDIFCPKEETFALLEGVLTEVMELFPGEYIHIGGDEAPKTTWIESAVAQEVIRREGLKDEHELQSWFIHRIERFLNANGRKLIGWDEIAEGGLSPTATVMYWRDRRETGLGHGPLAEDPARLAARSGNAVVMTPNQTFYLDHYQGFPAAEPLGIGGYTPLEQVYAYDPVPADFTPEMAARVIGAQANVWTEYIRTPEHVEYMAFPRMLAVAEVAWTPRASRDFASFTRRLPGQLDVLRQLGVSYREPKAGEPGARADAAASPRVVGYIASWSPRSKGLRIRDVPGSALTHLFYAFGRIGQDGLASLGDACIDIGECGADGLPEGIVAGGNFEQLRLLKRRYPHLRLAISLGGWGGSRWFSDAALTAESRERAVRSTLDVFLRPYPELFDGVDVDWEFPVAGGERGNIERPEDRENHTLLLQEFRRQLDALGRERGRRYELSIAASASPARIADLELDLLPAILDFINVMTYDYHTGGRTAHFNAPLRGFDGDASPGHNIEATMRVFTDAGVPKHQLVVGAPFYGRVYGGVEPANNGLLQAGDPGGVEGWGRGSIDYRVLAGRDPLQHGFTRHWHPVAQVPWLYNPTLKAWITYDDPESVAAKARFARDEGFGGVMFWELGGDDGSLLRALVEGLGLTWR